jgi:hypothetical protein
MNATFFKNQILIRNLINIMPHFEIDSYFLLNFNNRYIELDLNYY